MGLVMNPLDTNGGPGIGRYTSIQDQDHERNAEKAHA